MSNRRRDIALPTITLTIALCITYVIESYNDNPACVNHVGKVPGVAASDISKKDCRAYIDRAANAVQAPHCSIINTDKLNTEAILLSESTTVDRGKGIITEDVVATDQSYLSKVAVSEHIINQMTGTDEFLKYDTGIAEKEKQRLANLVVFSVLCDILLYKMKFDSEDNGNLERFNKDPEGNESGGRNDNGLTKYLLLCGLCCAHSVVEGQKILPENGLTYVTTAASVAASNTCDIVPSKRPRSEGSVATTTADVEMKDKPHDGSSSSTYCQSHRHSITNDSVSIVSEKQKIDINSDINTANKSITDVLFNWYIENIGFATHDKGEPIEILMCCSSELRINGIIFETKSRLCKDMVNAAGTNVFWDKNNGVALIIGVINAQEQSVFIVTKVEDNSVAKAKLFETYERTKSSNFDEQGEISACGDGIQVHSIDLGDGIEVLTPIKPRSVTQSPKLQTTNGTGGVHVALNGMTAEGQGASADITTSEFSKNNQSPKPQLAPPAGSSDPSTAVKCTQCGRS